jgi:Ni,Fe-hydrogenase III large subunit
VEPDVERLRGIGLELERVAMHLSGLSGMATDVAFLQGASTYGRLRTTAINTSMLLCGSRFGRGFLRVARLGVSEETLTAVRKNVARLHHDLAIIHPRFLGSYTVQHRLQGVGVVSRATALELGLVGQAARASGVALDTRTAHPGALYTRLPVALVVEESGDCWARALVRVGELTESLRWLSQALDGPGFAPVPDAPACVLPPGKLAVSVREGFRGEVVHVLETDDRGSLRRYRLQDPSLRNWFGLAMALRGNDISDFPICNKSFDLSYCGHDL